MNRFHITFETNAFADMTHLSGSDRADLIRTMIDERVLDLCAANIVAIEEAAGESLDGLSS